MKEVDEFEQKETIKLLHYCAHHELDRVINQSLRLQRLHEIHAPKVIIAEEMGLRDEALLALNETVECFTS